MIITEPNEFAAEIHDRMPVFLTEQQLAPWLSGEVGAEYLKPAPNDYLQRWPVSNRVNSSKADADDATLIEPIHLAARIVQSIDTEGAHPAHFAGRPGGRCSDSSDSSNSPFGLNTRNKK
jgi:SOS response associated peptidase (SRAP)